MKRLLQLVAVATLIHGVAFAQGSLDDEISVELDKMYEQQGAGAAQGTTQGAQAAQVQVNVQAQPQANAVAEQKTAVVTEQVQKQPTTTIEASPLTESRAEKLRKARQDAELSTEQTIVEKLEESRMEDERRRSEILFGDKFNQLGTKNQAPAATTPAPVQEVQVAPAPGMDREAVRGEVNAALDEYKASQVKPENKSYVGAIVGTGDYPDAQNVKGNYAAGFAVGKKFDKLVIEGSFLYSNYQVEKRGAYCSPNVYGAIECYPPITEMDQYNAAGLVKYQLLNGVFRPVLGAALSYTYRVFTDTQFSMANSESASSQAMDMGLMTGVDLELTESFSLGLDFRYMWNVTNRVNTGFQKSYVGPYLRSEKPIEQLNYYTMGLVGRMTF